MEKVSFGLAVFFSLTTFLAVFLFFKAANKSVMTLWVIFAWLTLQAMLARSGFYTVTDSMPPRFVLMVLPAILTILFLFFSEKGMNYTDRLNPATLHLLHVVRIPVELSLFWLFQAGAIPQLMTFEGVNFDILAGITSPIVYFLAFRKNVLSKKVLLYWNYACIMLLANIVIHAILSAPSPFQQLAFDQPNIAILYFPFNWLPAFVVPVVLYAHLASVRKLRQEIKS